MSTEYATRYETPDRSKNAKLKSAVGPKEISGFTHNKEKEDVLTETPGERWLYNNRYTGNSDYKDKFVPYVYPKVRKRSMKGLRDELFLELKFVFLTFQGQC